MATWMSPACASYDQFANFEESLRDELQDYLAEHARRERYVLLSESSNQIAVL